MDEDSETFSDWEDDANDMSIKSLFSSQTSTDVLDILQNDAVKYNFDLREIAAKFCVDEVDLIKLINFIRAKVASKKEAIDSDFISALKWSISADEFMDDTFLKSAMENDGLMCCLDSVMEFDEVEDDDNNNVQNNENYNKDKLLQRGIDINTMDSYKTILSELQNTKESAAKEIEPENDSYYFDSYGHISIHETMLRDSSRTLAYGNSLFQNPEYVKNKLVIDVGCGTGILSMFAVKAGAAHVISIDNSSIIELTKQIIKDNQFEHHISTIQGRVEEICTKSSGLSDPNAISSKTINNHVLNELLSKYLPVCTGVIIISEWMGYGLYYENMLSSVFVMRDYVSAYAVPFHAQENFVSMFPHTAEIFIEALTIPSEESNLPTPPGASAATIPCSSTEDRIDYWEHVYGFNMSRIKPIFLKEAAVQFVENKYCITNRTSLHVLNCMTAADEELDFVRSFQLKTVSNESIVIKAFVLSFDVIFNSPGVENVITLSTTPAAKDTHWKQTVCWLDPVNRIQAFTAQDEIQGKVTYKRCAANPRDYDITVEWNVIRKDQALDKTDQYSYKQLFTLSS